MTDRADNGPSPSGSADPSKGAGGARLVHVDGIEGPAARLRVTPEGVELTFLAERHAGFLAWLARGGDNLVYRLMREYERMADVDEAFAEGSETEDNKATAR